jgi:hypothetical protein
MECWISPKKVLRASVVHKENTSSKKYGLIKLCDHLKIAYKSGIF